MPKRRFLLLLWLVSLLASSKVIDWFYFFQPPESHGRTLPVVFFRDSMFGRLEFLIGAFGMLCGCFFQEEKFRCTRCWKSLVQDLKGCRWLYKPFNSLVHLSPTVSTISTYLRQHSYCYLYSTSSNVAACDFKSKMSLSFPKAPALNYNLNTKHVNLIALAKLMNFEHSVYSLLSHII